MLGARYHMLIASLPALPARLDADYTPITLERLEARLKMLDPADAEEIERMKAVLAWLNQFAEKDDAAIVKRFDALMAKIESPLVRELLDCAVDMRMIGVALRARRLGRDLPLPGLGPRANHLRLHFKRPDLGLGQRYPWIVEAERMLAEGQLLELFKRHVLGTVWDLARRRAQDHDFDFEAVVLYIARWDCVRRWHALAPEKGREIFDALVTETLGEYATKYA